MIFDCNIAEINSRIHKYDVCIGGAGVAGITLATSLARRGHKVALIEAGDREYSEDSQEVYRGESIGHEYWDNLENCRLRFFGGTSNHWTGLCGLLDEFDFHHREYYDFPGWPIKKSDLDPYIPRALEILDMQEKSFAIQSDYPLRSKTIKLRQFLKSPPTRFNDKYFDHIKNSNAIDCFINCNITDIRLNNQLTHTKYFTSVNYAGKKFEFKSKYFVLCFGAVENARILLNSNRQYNNGIGNNYDLVGRCFMEHLGLRVGRFVTNKPMALMGDRPHFMPSAGFVNRAKISNATFTFNTDFEPRSYGRLAELKQALRDLGCSSQSARDLSRHLIDFDCPGDGVITTMMEQSPNRQSRLLLDKNTDRFGLRRVILDWQLNEIDRRTIKNFAIEVGKELARINLARIKVDEAILRDPKGIEIGGHCHQMGTTRMSDNPKMGVVDSDCKIHEIGNLFIGGSSVFSTSGAVNPTFTIVQLSLRLAEHLKKLLN